MIPRTSAIALSSALLFAFAAPLKAETPQEKIAAHLVRLENGALKPAPADTLKENRLLAVYFSAEWCPPCRMFTPKLVEFYRGVKKENPGFEVVFVSADRTEKDMLGYMVKDEMPWPAMAYAKNDLLGNFAGPGIPCLVVLDGTGKVLSDSFAGTEYRGAQAVLDDLKKLIDQGAAKK